MIHTLKLAALFLITTPLMALATVPAKVPASFTKIYVPEGFDSNDNVQLVGVGLYNNSCYRNAETSVKVNHASKTILLGPLTYQYGGLCLQVMMPFDRVVDVGILQAGTYTIQQENDQRVLGRIDIRATTKQEPDDSLYAPISQAFFQANGGKQNVALTGEFPLSCMKMSDVKFSVQADVLVVQPMVMIDKNVPCNKGSFPFTIGKEVGAMKAGRYLMHIRSMNGKAVNNLVDVK